MLKIYEFYFAIVLCSQMLIISCNSSAPTEPILTLPEFNANQYEIQNLDFGRRWFNERTPPGFELNFPHDVDGVILSDINGGYYYHPYAVINQAINYWVGLELTSDPRYLNLIDAYINRLMIEGHRRNNAIYFPYQFSYNYAGNSNMVMVPPWYSGFAQGLALMFFSRMYETTGNDYYRAIADSVYNSFLAADTNLQAWVTFVDSLGYFWIEEYPFCPQIHVYNGFNTGIFGLFDYYMISNDENCKKLIRGGCTTISHYFDQYRVPGGISYYSLRVREQYSGYHGLVILELRKLSDITGDSSFSRMADTLLADYVP
jgi:hypothetical protein